MHNSNLIYDEHLKMVYVKKQNLSTSPEITKPATKTGIFSV